VIAFLSSPYREALNERNTKLRGKRRKKIPPPPVFSNSPCRETPKTKYALHQEKNTHFLKKSRRREKAVEKE
jgi:hypothetical protein